MTVNAVGAFGGLGAAQVNERGVQLPPGVFLLQIEKPLLHDSKNGKGRLFIVEFIVLETSDPVDCPVGSKRSWIQKMSVQPALGALKEFFYAAYQYDRRNGGAAADAQCRALDATIEQVAEQSVNANTLRGQRVRDCAILTETKGTQGKPPSPFLLHTFSPGNAATPAPAAT